VASRLAKFDEKCAEHETAISEKNIGIERLKQVTEAFRVNIRTLQEQTWTQDELNELMDGVRERTMPEMETKLQNRVEAMERLTEESARTLRGLTGHTAAQPAPQHNRRRR